MMLALHYLILPLSLPFQYLTFLFLLHFIDICLPLTLHFHYRIFPFISVTLSFLLPSWVSFLISFHYFIFPLTFLLPYYSFSLHFLIFPLTFSLLWLSTCFLLPYISFSLPYLSLTFLLPYIFFLLPYLLPHVQLITFYLSFYLTIPHLDLLICIDMNRVMLVLLEGRASWIRTVDGERMAVEHFPERTFPKWIARQPMLCAGWRSRWWRQGCVKGFLFRSVALHVCMGLPVVTFSTYMTIVPLEQKLGLICLSWYGIWTQNSGLMVEHACTIVHGYIHIYINTYLVHEHT